MMEPAVRCIHCRHMMEPYLLGDHKCDIQTSQEEFDYSESCVQPPDPFFVETERAGDGKTYPKKGQTVVIHYVGKMVWHVAVFEISC